MVALRLIDERSAGLVMRYLAICPSDWFVGPPWFPFWQPLTSGFLHSFEPGHVIWNMLHLYFFGTFLEEIIGARRFIWVYLGAVFAGSFAHLLFQPLFDPDAFAVGASGAVLGITIMMAVLRPNTRILLIFIPVTLKWLAIGIVCIDVFRLLDEMSGRADNIAHWVHLGGAAFGFVAARKGLIWKDPITGWKIKQERRRADRARDEDMRMDELLAKIHRDGMNSLSRGERAFLKRVSNRD